MRPKIVGIGGPSGSGKSTLARAVAALLRPRRVSTISLDSYYRDMTGRNGWDPAAHNFDTPAALDIPLLITHLDRLSAGGPVDLPVYSYRTHGRTGESVRVDPGSILIVEGLFVLSIPEIADRCPIRVYVDLPAASRLARRISRDESSRGADADETRRRFIEQVIPMERLHVLPGRSTADLILDGARPTGDNAAMILRAMGEQSGIGD